MSKNLCRSWLVLVFCSLIYLMLSPVSVSGFDQNDDLDILLFGEKVQGESSVSSITYLISVDYDRKVEDIIKTNRYDWSDGDITSDNFPAERTGVATITTMLLQIWQQNVSYKEALKEFDRLGYRGATLRELLVFDERYPDVGRSGPVIALGSVGWVVCNSKDCGRLNYHFHRNVPVLDGTSYQRCLNLSWAEDGWGGGCRFAVVRK